MSNGTEQWQTRQAEETTEKLAKMNRRTNILCGAIAFFSILVVGLLVSALRI